MDKDEALRLAWGALEDIGDEWGFTSQRTVPKRKEAITAIKAALEAKDDGITLTTIRHPQGKPALGDLNPESLETMEIDVPDQKLIAWYDPTNGAISIDKDSPLFTPLGQVLPLYSQRTWVGLTKEERHEISLANKPYVADIMAAHEKELKRRNT
jgi:hypothetical protein